MMTTVATGMTERGRVQAGRRRAERVATTRATGSATYVLGHLLAVAAAAGAWYLLVRAAIDFGRSARATGAVEAWLLCAAGTVGATVCLLLVLVLLARVWARVAGPRGYTPRRSSGGKRGSLGRVSRAERLYAI